MKFFAWDNALSMMFFICLFCTNPKYFAFHILTDEYDNIDKPGKSEEFINEFGIQPDVELGAIHVKRVRLHDTSSRWRCLVMRKSLILWKRFFNHVNGSR